MLLVVAGETTSLTCKTLEDILDKGVHNNHGLLGDTSVGVDLLEHFVDVGGVGAVVALLAMLLANTSSFLRGLGLWDLQVDISE